MNDILLQLIKNIKALESAWLLRLRGMYTFSHIFLSKKVYPTESAALACESKNPLVCESEIQNGGI